MKVRAALSCSSIGSVDVIDASVSEEISRPTHARVTVHADAPLDLGAGVGQTAKLSFSADGKSVRTFELVVVAVSAVDTDAGDLAYSIELEHEMSLMALRRDARIFLDMTTKELVTSVLSGAGVSATATWSVSKTLLKRESCAQARESDLDFVARLLADEGIFYFVKDGDDGVMFADQKSAFASIAGAPKVPLSGENQGEGIHTFEVLHAMTTDVVTLTDWNEKTPGVDLRSTTVVSDKLASERFEYPGRYATQGEGKVLAKIRAEEIAASQVTARGTSTRPELAAGAFFELAPGPASIAKKYLIRAVSHHVSRDSDNEYENAFVCSPLDLPFRPARKARPRIAGAHVATVAGPSGEEIHTDDLGRMKATFAFDRTAAANAMASPWIRVAQPMLGGGMTLARVGWEMAVRYIDGDPDRPVAVARLWDGTHVPPEALPGAQATTSIQTPSSPRAEHRNALTMNDKGGEMKLSVLAAKDFDATVNHDRKETIGVDDSLSVGQDATTLIGGKQTVTIEGDASTTAQKDAGLAIAGDREKTVSGDESVDIGSTLSLKVGGDESETTDGSYTQKADGQITETVAGAHDATAGGTWKTYAGKDYVIYVAGKSTEAVSGARTVSSSDGALTESIGGDFSITIGAARAETVTGKRLSTVQGASALTIGAAGSITATGKLQIKASKIKITIGGSGTVMAGGGIVSLTPASVAFVGMITLKGSGGVELAGSPGMAG